MLRLLWRGLARERNHRGRIAPPLSRIISCMQIPKLVVDYPVQEFKAPLLIGVSAKKEHGKDTFFQLLSEMANTQVHRIALGDPLKREVAEFLSLNGPPEALRYFLTNMQLPHETAMELFQATFWDADNKSFIDWRGKRPPEQQIQYLEKLMHLQGGPEKMRLRMLLQIWGTEYRRKRYGEDYWTNKFRQAVSMVPHMDVAVCTDPRFPNEADLVKSLRGKMVRVHRPDYVTSDPNVNHPSELGLDDYQGFDYRIENTTLEHYREQVRKIAVELGIPLFE